MGNKSKQRGAVLLPDEWERAWCRQALMREFRAAFEEQPRYGMIIRQDLRQGWVDLTRNLKAADPDRKDIEDLSLNACAALEYAGNQHAAKYLRAIERFVVKTLHLSRNGVAPLWAYEYMCTVIASCRPCGSRREWCCRGTGFAAGGAHGRRLHRNGVRDH